MKGGVPPESSVAPATDDGRERRLRPLGSINAPPAGRPPQRRADGGTPSSGRRIAAGRCRPTPRWRRSPPRGRTSSRSEALLGNECLPNRCSRPSVRAVNRWNLLRVQPLGDLLQRHPLPKHHVDLHPPSVVTSVAEPMREPDVVGGEVTSVCLESRVVVGRRLPIGTRRPRLEVPTTPEAVALGHLATHVDDLAIPGKLPEDSANSQGLELLNWGFSSVRRCRWGSSLRDLVFVVHLLGPQSSKVATIGLWSLKAHHSVGLNAAHRRSLSARAGEANR
jgi:hypothetical protein